MLHSSEHNPRKENMAISLNKGGNVSLLKSEPGLKKISVGLGWDVRATEGADFDLDASVFLTGETGKKLAGVCDHAILVASKRTARIQEAHIFIGHVWCEIVDDRWTKNAV